METSTLPRQAPVYHHQVSQQNTYSILNSLQFCATTKGLCHCMFGVFFFFEIMSNVHLLPYLLHNLLLSQFSSCNPFPSLRFATKTAMVSFESH